MNSSPYPLIWSLISISAFYNFFLKFISYRHRRTTRVCFCLPMMSSRSQGRCILPTMNQFTGPPCCVTATTALPRKRLFLAFALIPWKKKMYMWDRWGWSRVGLESNGGGVWCYVELLVMAAGRSQRFVSDACWQRGHDLLTCRPFIWQAACEIIKCSLVHFFVYLPPPPCHYNHKHPVYLLSHRIGRAAFARPAECSQVAIQSLPMVVLQSILGTVRHATRSHCAEALDTCQPGVVLIKLLPKKKKSHFWSWIVMLYAVYGVPLPGALCVWRTHMCVCKLH